MQDTYTGGPGVQVSILCSLPYQSIQFLIDHDHECSNFPEPQRRLNYSALKKAHAARTTPVLREEDLEESFVRGASALHQFFYFSSS